jgi:hypothetical protein
MPRRTRINKNYTMNHDGFGQMIRGPKAIAAVTAATKAIAAKDPGYEAHTEVPRERATAVVVAVGWWGQTRQAHLKLQADAGTPPSKPNVWPDPGYMGRRSPEYEWGRKAD